jgi:hypothetical protein
MQTQKIIIGVVLAAAAAVGVASASSAKAETARKPPVSRAQAEAAAPATPWAGCGIGAHAGIGVAVNTLGWGDDGAIFGVDASCDWQQGRGVVGIAVNYTKAAGESGAEYGVSARAGYLVWPSALAYMRAGWSRVDANGGAGEVDGYKIGLGVELKMPDAPIFVALEGRRNFYSDVFNTGVDHSGYEMLVRTTYKFNFAR